MLDVSTICVYIFVMAGTTYLIRMLPLVLMRKKIENVFIQNFLFYVPYAVLAVMTVPAIFDSTASTFSAIIGFIVACVLGWFGAQLLPVAVIACASVFVVEFLMRFFT